MDELYELVSKEELKKLRGENKALKEQLEQVKTSTSSQEEQKSILETLDERFSQFEQKQEELLKNELSKISDTTKSSLNGVFSNYQEQQNKIDNINENLTEIIKTIHQVLDEMPDENSNSDVGKQIEELRNELSLKDLEAPEQAIHQLQQDLIKRMNEIQEFMSKLEQLLAQIKPSDMKMG